MRFIFCFAFLFFWSFVDGQSSAIGLHIGNVPPCNKIPQNQNQDNIQVSNQCYSLGISYHRPIKNQLFFAFRIQYQNIDEEVESNSKFIFPGLENQFTFTNITNNSQKEIIFIPSVYWTAGEHRLKPIVGFGIPLTIKGQSLENIYVSNEDVFKNVNETNINTTESNNELIKDGGVAVGLMAVFGMSCQINKRIQLHFNFTPSIYFQNNTTETQKTFFSQTTQTRIFNGNPDPPFINSSSDEQRTEESIKGIFFQEDTFLFSVLFQL